MKRTVFLLFVIVSLLTACSGDKKKPQSKGKSNSVKQVTIEKTDKSAVSSTKKTEAQTTEGATPAQLAKAKELLEQVDDADIDMVDAKKIFKMNCSLCHGFKGDMMINGAKDLVKSRIPIEEAVAQVYHGKGLMTPYKGVLTDAEIIAVALYTETLRK